MAMDYETLKNIWPVAIPYFLASPASRHGKKTSRRKYSLKRCRLGYQRWPRTPPRAPHRPPRPRALITGARSFSRGPVGPIQRFDRSAIIGASQLRAAVAIATALVTICQLRRSPTRRRYLGLGGAPRPAPASAPRTIDTKPMKLHAMSLWPQRARNDEDDAGHEHVRAASPNFLENTTPTIEAVEAAGPAAHNDEGDDGGVRSGLTFPGGESGISVPDTVCTPKSVGISVDTNTYEPHLLAGTMAHMIGHNIGMGHDDGREQCFCRDWHGCIMAQSIVGLENVQPYKFSDCSKNDYINELRVGQGLCLLNKPNEVCDTVRAPPTLTSDTPAPFFTRLRFGCPYAVLCLVCFD
ncbi:hypothetical protein EVAR_82289_1 [Eumeta japonica]|uniref:Peptidase M12B domain-containing protein n=1 Tax=Eumeta variegata TaxID=151549 RepID=A0A4C1W181_EUMVA|nr:hypothetical protein EVAR_82289_1 [Eumeta japonica]